MAACSFPENTETFTCWKAQAERARNDGNCGKRRERNRVARCLARKSVSGRFRCHGQQHWLIEVLSTKGSSFRSESEPDQIVAGDPAGHAADAGSRRGAPYRRASAETARRYSASPIATRVWRRSAACLGIEDRLSLADLQAGRSGLPKAIIQPDSDWRLA